MKIKDIKERLKKEHEGYDIPDMLPRVKRAPLNRLLSGETPAQAFRKELAVRLLVTATVLLIVAAIAFTAMILLPSHEKAKPYCYVSIEVQKEGETLNFGLVFSGDGRIVLLADESGQEGATKMKIVSISQLYQYGSTDKTSVCVICEDSELARDRLKYVAGELEAAYAFAPSASLSRRIGNEDDRARLSAIVLSLGGEECESLADLVHQYFALVG